MTVRGPGTATPDIDGRSSQWTLRVTQLKGAAPTASGQDHLDD